MESNELHDRQAKSLLDKITADPDIINRGLADAKEPVVVVPAAAPVAAPSPVDQPVAATPIVMQRDNVHRRPEINLLAPTDAEPAAVSPAAPAKTAAKPKAMLVAGGALVVLALVAGGGYWWFMQQHPPKAVQVAVRPTPTPAPAATPSPTATPTPAPPPSPTPTPVPQSVTAPAVTPTASHPQAVVVKSPSGLWLRSTPNSSNQRNVIGWMPNGATVSVDQVGDFWWHGSYSGKTGYFAVNYTK